MTDVAPVVSLAAHCEAEQEAAWEGYRLAALRAQETLDYRDGLACLRAWRRFLDLAEPPSRRGVVEKVAEHLAAKARQR